MKKHTVSFILGGIIAAASVFGELPTENTREIFKIISDGCFAAGVLLFGMGLLFLVFERGVFDMLFYGISGIVCGIMGKERDDYSKYKQKRSEKSYSIRGMIPAGAGYLCLAAVFMAFWYM